MSSDAVDSRRTSVAKSRIAIRWLGSLGLVLASLAAGLLLLEVGCRLAQSGLDGLRHWPNLVLGSRIEARKTQDSDAAYIHHPTLGFANSPNYASWALNFDAQGFRLTAPLSREAVQAPPILATGDSFTKGDEVGDAEAWPSRLQGLLDWRTINAGVGAFGLDQTVLLSEQLVPEVKPAVLVLGFIADDVRRAEMSRQWGRAKPWFERAKQRGESELVLRNVPVPPPPAPDGTLSPLQAAFGWSVLLDTVLDRLRLRNAWHADVERALPSGEGERLACPLMRRVAALGVPTLVVAQYLPSAWDEPQSAAEERRVARVVLDCAAQAGLRTLDLYPAFDAAIRARGRSAVFGGRWHPNWRGYLLTAEAVAQELRGAQLLRASP